MYSVIVDGKVLDFRYKNMPLNSSYVFYIGDIYVGQIFKIRNYWAIVPRTPVSSNVPLSGFATRYHASEALLTIEGYLKKTS